jgi:hypothetical protein
MRAFLSCQVGRGGIEHFGVTTLVVLIMRAVGLTLLIVYSFVVVTVTFAGVIVRVGFLV